MVVERDPKELIQLGQPLKEGQSTVDFSCKYKSQKFKPKILLPIAHSLNLKINMITNVLLFYPL